VSITRRGSDPFWGNLEDRAGLPDSPGNEIDDKSQDLLRRLSIYYLETRYPDKRKDLELKCTHEYTGELLAATKGVIEWLKNKLR